MLLQIRDFIAREQVVSAEQLARAFHLSLSALEPMMTCWVRKGVIALEVSSSCAQGSCAGCHVVRRVGYYRYLG